MMKNFTRMKSLFLAALFTSLLSPVIGGIVYHDEDPDATQTQTTDGGQAFAIDMDGDLTVDFTLIVTKGDTSFTGTPFGTIEGNGAAVFIEPSTGNSTSEGSSSPIPVLKAHDNGDNISSSLTWKNSRSLLRFDGNITQPVILAGPVSYGNFTNSTDKYIGVKFTSGANTHYGWIRVAVSSTGDSYTVKDWAYEDTPDTDIDAGEMPVTSINNQLASTTTLINNNNVIDLNFAQPLSGTVQVVNMNGSIVASEKFNGKSCKINLQGKTSGIYSLLFETSSGEFAKKIYIE